MTVRVRLLEQPLDYDGSQLSSQFAYRTTGLVGDAAVAFLGACEVRDDTMVDLEDLKAGASIRSPHMLHVIAEHFGQALEPTIWRQRVFCRLAADLLQDRGGRPVRVRGDDLYVDERKASISVATVSPVSGLFHFGLNVRTEGVPVPAIGLEELGVDPIPFASDLLSGYESECADVLHASVKVRWVR